MIKEGYIDFREFKTYYRIVGDVQESLSKGLAPLVLLHGGPGSTHNYFELLDPLGSDGRAIVMYDQLGCGNSYVDGRPELWVKETWEEELDNLLTKLGITKFHLLGQSWGGMLAISYLVDYKPKGVVSLILSSSLSESQLWGIEQHRQMKFMPKELQEGLREAELSGDFGSKGYLDAIDVFMERHCCDLSYGLDAPECLRRKKKSGSESYVTAWGPDELTPKGTLADWNYTGRLCEIEVPALIISGTDDLCTPRIAKTMYDNLKDARWELFADCRHMCFADNTPKYLQLMREWMQGR